MRLDEAPLLIFWETTQGSEFSCVHCRPSATNQRYSSELPTEDAYRLLDTIREFGTPTMVFTGGDPLKRPDLFPLLRHSVALGLRTDISPGITPLLTKDRIWDFRKSGVARMAIRLDDPDADADAGPDAANHGLGDGSGPAVHPKAIEALEEARRIGLETELQTLVTRRNMHRLSEIAGLAARAGCRLWSVGFPVVAGLAAEDDLTTEEYENTFEKIYDIARAAMFEVKTSDAPQYRRYVARRLRERPEPADPLRTVFRTANAGDGRGSIFISYSGEIYPSGSLPISAGNVRCDSLVQVYRKSALFLELRDSGLRHGKCGFCEYRRLCGGSRSRAFAFTGDFQAQDPRCSYQPVLQAVEA